MSLPDLFGILFGGTLAIVGFFWAASAFIDANARDGEA